MSSSDDEGKPHRLQLVKLARLRAEELELEQRLKLKNRRRDPVARSLLPDLSSSPPDSTRYAALQSLSPAQRRVVDDEIIKRRRLDQSPTIKNSLVSSPLRTPPKSGRSSVRPEIEVPHTPTPKKSATHVPARVRLGLDTGLKADEVKLGRKKAPKSTVPTSQVVITAAQDSNSLLRAPTLGLKSTMRASAQKRDQAHTSRKGTAYEGIKRNQLADDELPHKSSFGDRYVADRERRKQRREQDKKTEDELVIDPPVQSATAIVQTATPAPSVHSDSDPVDLRPKPPAPNPDLADLLPKLSGSKTDLVDTYTGLDLLTRYLSVEQMAANLAGKQTMTVSELCAVVTPPDYENPSIPDWAVFGVVAKKSTILYQKKRSAPVERTQETITDASQLVAEPKQPNARGKPKDDSEKRKQEADEIQRRRYFILTLTDLKQELHLYVMGPPLDRLWPLRIGDVVAVCNPGVWKAKDGAGFKLNLTEHDDVVYEVGRARDFGICRSLTRKETKCTNWVDLRKTEYCEFHVELAVRRTSNRRAETNKGMPLYSPKRNGQRLVMTKNSGLLPDPLGPRPNRANKGGSIYVLEGFKGEIDYDRPLNSKRWS